MVYIEIKHVLIDNLFNSYKRNYLLAHNVLMYTNSFIKDIIKNHNIYIYIYIQKKLFIGTTYYILL